MDIMMQAKVTKAVAAHTENAYSQAYNAGKLYVVLSIETSKKGVASLGKETLERLQREFFALDIKNLETIKKAVEEVIKDLPEDSIYNISLATPVEETLYIVTAGTASVVLIRNGSSHIIAKGEGGISAFSGIIFPGDIIALVTPSMLKKIPFSEFIKSLSLPFDEISENLAPNLIENVTGAEAALVISIPGEVSSSVSSIPEDEMMQEEAASHEKKKISLPRISIPQINIGKFRHLSRKQMAFLAAGILVLLLIGGIFFEQMNRSNNEREARLQEILGENKQAFEDAQAILSLNRSLAVEELTAIQQDIESELASFPEGSSQYKTLQEFLKKVTDIIGGGGGTAAEPTLFFEENPVEHMTFKGGKVVGIGDDTVNIISTEGTLEDDYDIGVSGKVSANDDNVYVLAKGAITRINKSNGQDTEIIEGLSNVNSFDVFGNNVYVLTNTILRFRANNFDEGNYLAENVTLEGPTSMSIDSSIWVIDNGKIRKFTRGEEEGFSVSGDLPLSESAIIYTDEEYDNLYILDPGKRFIAIIDKEGTPVKNLELTKIPNVTSFAVNEEDSKIYLVSEEKIYSVDF